MDTFGGKSPKNEGIFILCVILAFIIAIFILAFAFGGMVSDEFDRCDPCEVTL